MAVPVPKHCWGTCTPRFPGHHWEPPAQIAHNGSYVFLKMKSLCLQMNRQDHPERCWVPSPRFPWLHSSGSRPDRSQAADVTLEQRGSWAQGRQLSLRLSGEAAPAPAEGQTQFQAGALRGTPRALTPTPWRRVEKQPCPPGELHSAPSSLPSF